MIFAPLMFAVATATPQFDQWGFPRLTPGTWIVTTRMASPFPAVEAWKYCIPDNYAANLIQQFFERNQSDNSYDCSITSSAPGVGQAICQKLTNTATGMSVFLTLNWHVASNPGANFRADISGYGKMGSKDPRQPSGQAPVAETITGVYQHVPCAFSTPQPASVSPG